jgi:hypothetical protein
MIDIKAELTPLRLSLRGKEPVELMVELINNSNKTQMISLEISAGNELAFDKGGRGSIQSKHITEFKAGERLRDYYNIYPRPNVVPGPHEILIQVNEHFNNSFQYVQSKKVKELVLRVE